MAQNIYSVDTPVEAIVRSMEMKVHRRQLEDLLLQEVRDVASADQEYHEVLS